MPGEISRTYDGPHGAEDDMTYYAVTLDERVEIDNQFRHHPPVADQTERYERVREIMRRAAHDLMTLCPRCKERDDALGHLRLAMMLGNAAIACGEFRALANPGEVP